MENAAEETFCNQDTHKIGRFAEKSNYNPVIHGLFSLRASWRPIPSPSGESPKSFVASFAGAL